VRRILFWMHLGTGVLIGLLVLFFSVTGTLLAFERQIVHKADQRCYKADAVPMNGARIPLTTLIAKAEYVAQAPIEMVTVHPDPVLPVEMQTANRDVFLVDPYSSAVQGPASPRLRGFFAQVTALHRWFGLSNARHASAIAVKGAVSLLFLFLLISGAFLWMPRRWNRNILRSSIKPRFDVGGRARNYNWHKVTGFWIGLPLATIVVTGAVMAYPWANALLFRLAGSPVPARNPARENLRRHISGATALPNHLDEAFALATSNIQDWQSASLRLAPNPSEISFVVDRGDGGHPEKREQVSIDATTLRVLRRVPFSALSRGQQWRSWVRFVHTGEAGGWWGESMAMVTALGATLLSVTGLLMSLDRLRRSRH
jgi:uncharacterized iron-regulated membrane protein